MRGFADGPHGRFARVRLSERGRARPAIEDFVGRPFSFGQSRGVAWTNAQFDEVCDDVVLGGSFHGPVSYEIDVQDRTHSIYKGSARLAACFSVASAHSHSTLM